ncbi:MAG: ribonuclease catalytic domain-containing protein [Candidatus Cloacimonetes bacterium]|nr:ribonuclease catalytic domain-containing protein [Candidatus Cloacimonadota bacterium]
MEHIEQGTCVFFYHQNSLELGMIREVHPKFLLVFYNEGSLIKLTPQRIVLSSREVFNVSTPLQCITAFADRIDERIPQLDLEIITPRLETGRSYGFAELCALFSLDDDAQRFALFLTLKMSPETIAQKHSSFVLLSDSERKLLELKRAILSQQHAFLIQAEKLVQNVLSGVPATGVEKDFLSEFRYQLNENLLANENSDLIKLIQAHPSEHSFQEKIILLKRSIGDINPETDEVIALSGIPVCFPRAHTLEHPAPALTDLTHLQAFTIDDSETRDFDDAFTWESLHSGFRLGIHIAEVAAHTKKWNLLLAEARLRVSSLYLPSEEIPLLPENLSHDELSLKQGSLRNVLSLLVELGPDLKILGSSFTTSQIRIDRNYSYQEADKLMSEFPFKLLLSFQTKLQTLRQMEDKRGDDRYQYYLKLKGGHLHFKKIDRYSPSRLLVEELMIFYNSSLATYASELKMPLIHRNIEQLSYFNNENPEEAENGTSFFNAYLSTTPSYHPGIGADAYVHASSPLRRYTDILNQMQVSHYLRHQNIPFSSDELEKLIPEIETRLLLQKELIASSDRLWFLRYLNQECMNQPLQVKVLRKTKSTCIVEVSPWNRKLQLITDARIFPDTLVTIIPTGIDWEKGILLADTV